MNVISEIKQIIILYLESHIEIYVTKILKTMLYFCWTMLNTCHYSSVANSFLEVVEI